MLNLKVNEMKTYTEKDLELLARNLFAHNHTKEILPVPSLIALIENERYVEEWVNSLKENDSLVFYDFDGAEYAWFDCKFIEVYDKDKLLIKVLDTSCNPARERILNAHGEGTSLHTLTEFYERYKK